MTAGRISSDWVRLPHGLSVRFTYDPDTRALTCEWEPRPPATRREFSRLQREYRAARDAFLSSLAPGGNVLVIET